MKDHFNKTADIFEKTVSITNIPIIKRVPITSDDDLKDVETNSNLSESTCVR